MPKRCRRPAAQPGDELDELDAAELDYDEANHDKHAVYVTVDPAVAAALDYAQCRPGHPVNAPNDQIIIVVGNAGLVVRLAGPRKLIDQHIQKTAVHAALNMHNIVKGGARSISRFAHSLHVYLGVPLAQATNIAGSLMNNRYFDPPRGHTIDPLQRANVVTAILEPLVLDMCSAWPAVQLDACCKDLGKCLALWEPPIRSFGSAAVDAGLCDWIDLSNQHQDFLRELDQELGSAVRAVQRVACRWRESPVPQVTNGMILVPDVMTAIANVTRKCALIQRIDDPAPPRWLSHRDNIVTYYKEQPIRGYMETYVADHAGGSMLATRDASALDDLSPDTILRITPRAVDQLGRAIMGSAEPTTAFIDISLSTMVHLIAERAGPPGLDAAKAHLHAYLALLGPARCDFDGAVDLMASSCDLSMLVEIQALRDDVRASEDRSIAIQLDMDAAHDRLLLDMDTAHDRLLSIYCEIQASLDRLGCVLRETQAIPDQIIEYQRELIAHLKQNDGLAEGDTTLSNTADQLTRLKHMIDDSITWIIEQHSPHVADAEIPNQSVGRHVSGRSAHRANMLRNNPGLMSTIIMKVFEIDATQTSWTMRPDDIGKAITNSPYADVLTTIGTCRAIIANHGVVRPERYRPYLGIRPVDPALRRPAEILRQKKEEYRIEKALVAAGYGPASTARDSTPLPMEYRREHYVSFACMDLSFARIDFVVTLANGSVVLLEVDEHQHRFGYDGVGCDMRRMDRIVKALRVGGHTAGIRFVRYNCDSFRVGGTLVRVLKQDRESALLARLHKMGAETAADGSVWIGYCYYDRGVDSTQPDIVTDPEYHPVFRAVVEVMLT